MAQIKVGLSMLHCLGKPFAKMVKKIVEANVRCVEVIDDGFHALDKRKVSVLADLGKSHHLMYSVHAPFADINVASLSNFMLKAVIKRLEKSIENANSLDAYLWVFHPGSKTGLSMFYPKRDWIQNCKTTRLLSKIADDYGVKIAIENVPEPFPFLLKSVEDFAVFYDEVDEGIGLAFDVGHANLNGQMEQFLKRFASRIVHVHVHDNDGTGDQHRGIGYGTIDWKRFAQLLKATSFRGAILVECIDHVLESVRKVEQLLS